MKSVKIYYQEDINKLTRKRSGEKKIGESVKCSINNWEKDLDKSNCEFVIIGIPEDIGVRANYGRSGASSAFKPALDSFLSQQDNLFLNAENIFMGLGPTARGSKKLIICCNSFRSIFA